MNKDSVRVAYDQARDMVDGLDDERLRSVAFEVVFRRLLEQAGPLPPIVGHGERNAPGPQLAARAIGEFLSQVGVKSYPDRIVAIAYHRLHSGGDDAVSRAEFFDDLSRARIPRPKNLSDVIAQCVRKGHLMDAELKDGQRAWKITVTGESCVEERISRTQ